MAAAEGAVEGELVAEGVVAVVLHTAVVAAARGDMGLAVGVDAEVVVGAHEVVVLGIVELRLPLVPLVLVHEVVAEGAQEAHLGVDEGPQTDIALLGDHYHLPPITSHLSPPTYPIHHFLIIIF